MVECTHVSRETGSLWCISTIKNRQRLQFHVCLPVCGQTQNCSGVLFENIPRLRFANCARDMAKCLGAGGRRLWTIFHENCKECPGRVPRVHRTIAQSAGAKKWSTKIASAPRGLFFTISKSSLDRGHLYKSVNPLTKTNCFFTRFDRRFFRGFAPFF